MTRRLWDLVRFEASGIILRRWLLVIAAVGVAIVPIAAAVAARDGGATVDSYRRSAASLLLVGGLIVALSLGATVVGRGGATGHLGLTVAAGAGRTEVTVARLIGRLAALALILGAWCVALQIGSGAIGRGLDGPLAVHVAASGETLALVLLTAAAVSSVLGPIAAVIVGLATHVLAQVVVNLNAAADLGLLRVWDRMAHISYNLLPRAVYSPMIVEMQNRGQGGPAAPRFELDQADRVRIPVALPAASLGTVLWTAFWCLLLSWLCVLGMRRRTL